MDYKEIEAMWDAFQQVQEKKLSDKQKALDVDNDGDIEADDLADLRKKKNKADVVEEVPAAPIKKAPARKGDKSNPDASDLPSVKKESKDDESEEDDSEEDEKKTKKPKKGVNPFAKKKGEDDEEEGKKDVAEAAWLQDLAVILQGLDEKSDEHTKGATNPEGIADKESNKSKDFIAMHKKSEKDIEDKEEQGHKDVSKAGRATKASPARAGSDQLKNGDKAVVNPVGKKVTEEVDALKTEIEELRQILESSNSDLGHLAAKHFEHHGNSDPDMGHPDPERAGHAAKATLNRIKKVHGASAASAVKQHSSDANDHDNGSLSGSKKGFHGDFVKKHLGGKGSDSHKAYKAHMKATGHTQQNIGQKTHHD